MSNLKLDGYFIASKQKTYGDNKTLTNFWLKLDKDTDYPTTGEFTFFGDKIDLSKVKEGDKLTVSFGVSGRKWQKGDRSGFSQSLVAWKIEVKGAGAVPPPPAAKKDEAKELSDDLPF